MNPQKIFLKSVHHLKDLSPCDISCTDMTPNMTSPSGRNRKLNISKNHISWTTEDIFYNLYIILKIYHYITISYTDMTLIWPLLPFENGRLRKKNIRQYYSVCIVYTQFTRKRPFPHT